MAVAIEDTHRWTREEYERKAAEGFFSPDARVELVEGIVYAWRLRKALMPQPAGWLRRPCVPCFRSIPATRSVV